MNQQRKPSNGFSMLELLVATAIFTVIAGGIFSVLFSSQVRYQSDSGLTTAFQQANIVMDQIVRDIHSSGYPPASAFNMGINSYNYAVAFPWSPNYPGTPCTLYSSCSLPGDNDLILETAAENGIGVQWIRYTLQGTTLQRGSMLKGSGDPSNATWTMTAYLENVMNQSGSPTQPIFQYFDSSGTSLTGAAPSQIHEVKICLIVQSSKPDPQTGQYRTVTLTGQAVAFNQ